MPDLSAIPPSLVEAAARALYAADCEGVLAGADGSVGPDYDAMARVALAAALAECEVREEWGAELVIPGREHKNPALWYPNRVEALRTRREHIPLPPVTMGGLVQRLAIFTPASPVDTPREDPRS